MKTSAALNTGINREIGKTNNPFIKKYVEYQFRKPRSVPASISFQLIFNEETVRQNSLLLKVRNGNEHG